MKDDTDCILDLNFCYSPNADRGYTMEWGGRHPNEGEAWAHAQKIYKRWECAEQFNCSLTKLVIPAEPPKEKGGDPFFDV